LSIWQLLATTSVTLTLLVTVFFLAPTAPYHWILLFADSNFLLHLVNPLLSIIAFVCFEKTTTLTIKHTCIGILPMVIYSVYYIGAAVTHSTDGVVDYGYDWYGFLVAGLKSAFIVIPIIVVFTYLISFVLWKLNKLKAS
ncbi:MAG: hypothetical protein K5675_01390, partial [Lachnospiraceae bacterium]|nr:hypothetical protein [Lachnospiraceae bacterium]